MGTDATIREGASAFSTCWRGTENGFDICNGNRIDDDARCDNGHCQLFAAVIAQHCALNSRKVHIIQILTVFAVGCWPGKMRGALTTPELRATKLTRDFPA